MAPREPLWAPGHASSFRQLRPISRLGPTPPVGRPCGPWFRHTALLGHPTVLEGDRVGVPAGLPIYYLGLARGSTGAPRPGLVGGRAERAGRAVRCAHERLGGSEGGEGGGVGAHLTSYHPIASPRGAGAPAAPAAARAPAAAAEAPPAPHMPAAYRASTTNSCGSSASLPAGPRSPAAPPRSAAPARSPLALRE
eukprot:scaffold57333_cov42-Phaeocystis_antarctica.AAC.1